MFSAARYIEIGCAIYIGNNMAKEKQPKEKKEPKPKKEPRDSMQVPDGETTTRQTIVVDIKQWDKIRDAAKTENKTISKWCYDAFAQVL